ncbi:MAG: GEVED domain-containing protein, partial [Planctomycetaceae bacterium]
MLISNWLSRHAQAVSSVPVKFRRDRRRPQVQQCFRPSDLTRQVDVLEDRTLLAADFGDAPTGYPVTQAENGAEHAASGPMLGATRDMETDGTHSASADADGADEDGVVETGDFIVVGQTGAGVTVNVQNASGGALLDAWMDFNADGDWDDAGEQIFTSTSVENGDNALTFDVPGTAVVGITYARLRLSTAGGLSVTGSAADGEVEDYEIEISAQADFGDAPASYPVTRSDNGAEHAAFGPMLGATRDMETDGTHSASADADGADEDGVLETGDYIVAGQTASSVTVNVQNASSGALLDAWMDFNADGDWEDAGEQIFASTLVVNGDNALTFNVPSTAVVGTTYARLRLSTAGGLGVTGSAADGEVEDYEIEISAQADFGDAPAPYPVTRSEMGAQHLPTGPTLGPLRDAEIDGTHSTMADADGADEDGVLETGDDLVAGETGLSVTINVQNAPSGALLDAWMDFNADGDWDDAGEQIFSSASVVNGDNPLTMDVPADAAPGITYARLRLSTAGGLGVTGTADDGEVEDYEIEITAAETAPEGETGSFPVVFSDPEIGASKTFVLTGGADDDQFVIDAGTGVLQFANAPDFENPADDGGDNVYEVRVVVVDSELHTAAQDIQITVTDLNDDPVFVAVPDTISDGATQVGMVVAMDEDLPAQAVLYGIDGGADAGLFSIDSMTGVLSFTSAPDYASPADDNGDGVYEVVVEADDQAGGVSTQAVQVTVLPPFTFNSMTGALTVPVVTGELTLKSTGSTGEVVINDIPVGVAVTSVTAILVQGTAGGDFIELEEIDEVNMPALTSAIQVDAGDGDDSILGSALGDLILAGDGDDFVFADDGANTLFGGAGDDVLLGGQDVDSMDGGEGGDFLLGMAGDDVMTGGPGNDSLLGAAGSDNLSGDAGDDHLRGMGASGDVLSGGAGTDELSGGAGTDQLLEVFSTAADIRLSDTELEVDGTIEQATGFEQAAVTAGDGGVSINTQNFSGSASLTGGAGPDSILSGDGNDILFGLAGNDVLSAGAGDDLLFGSSGRDRLNGGPGDDVVKGQGTSGDTVEGGAGSDLLDGGSGGDRLYEFFVNALNIGVSDS